MPSISYHCTRDCKMPYSYLITLLTCLLKALQRLHFLRSTWSSPCRHLHLPSQKILSPFPAMCSSHTASPQFLVGCQDLNQGCSHCPESISLHTLACFTASSLICWTITFSRKSFFQVTEPCDLKSFYYALSLSS